MPVAVKVAAEQIEVLHAGIVGATRGCPGGLSVVGESSVESV